jgi:hypothetical protein
MACNVKITVGICVADFGKLWVKWPVDGIYT